MDAVWLGKQKWLKFIYPQPEQIEEFSHHPENKNEFGGGLGMNLSQYIFKEIVIKPVYFSIKGSPWSLKQLP